MNENPESLIRKLQETRSLEEAKYAELIRQRTPESAQLLADLAVAERKRIYGNDVFIRGLIEFTNICRNDCLYCGLRRSNTALVRYRLTPEAILSCSTEGLNGLSRNYHRLIRDEVIPPRWRGMKKPVLVNSWEACYFGFDAEKLLALARSAAELGMEMLVPGRRHHQPGRLDLQRRQAGMQPEGAVGADPRAGAEIRPVV